MIYEYPNEFIVPVVYVEDLLQKRNGLIRDWNPFDMGENLQGNEIDHENMEDNGQNQEMKSPYIYQGLLKNQNDKSTYNYNMAQEISDNDNTKSILNDIDEDYANSETLSM
jgi:hypothetical protein